MQIDLDQLHVQLDISPPSKTTHLYSPSLLIYLISKIEQVEASSSDELYLRVKEPHETSSIKVESLGVFPELQTVREPVGSFEEIAKFGPNPVLREKA